MAGIDDNAGPLPEDEEYDRLALLEDLETMLEEMEEQGVVTIGQPEAVSSVLAERMSVAGVRDVQQLRDRIRQLHAELDEDDRDFTITES